jgi:hypothetical protein
LITLEVNTSYIGGKNHGKEKKQEYGGGEMSNQAQ